MRTIRNRPSRYICRFAFKGTFCDPNARFASFHIDTNTARIIVFSNKLLQNKKTFSDRSNFRWIIKRTGSINTKCELF